MSVANISGDKHVGILWNSRLHLVDVFKVTAGNLTSDLTTNPSITTKYFSWSHLESGPVPRSKKYH
jgi:hypothetical protein